MDAVGGKRVLRLARPGRRLDLHLLVLAVSTAVICFAEVALPHSVVVVPTSSRRAPLSSASYDIQIMIPASSDTVPPTRVSCEIEYDARRKDA